MAASCTLDVTYVPWTNLTSPLLMAALTGRSSLTGFRGSLHLNKQPRFHASKRIVTVRADNDSKVVREYREDEDKVVVPGSSGVEQRADGLYVDSTSRPVSL